MTVAWMPITQVHVNTNIIFSLCFRVYRYCFLLFFCLFGGLSRPMHMANMSTHEWFHIVHEFFFAIYEKLIK